MRGPGAEQEVEFPLFLLLQFGPCACDCSRDGIFVTRKVIRRHRVHSRRSMSSWRRSCCERWYMCTSLASALGGRMFFGGCCPRSEPRGPPRRHRTLLYQGHHLLQHGYEPSFVQDQIDRASHIRREDALTPRTGTCCNKRVPLVVTYMCTTPTLLP